MQNNKRKTILRLALAGLATATLSLNVQAATVDTAKWPEHPLTLIVPFGAGSTPDQIARLVAQSAEKKLGQTIVVENKAGAGGNIGTNQVAKAKPDGYTFGISITGPLVNNQFIYKNLPYNPEKDLAPLTMAVTQPNVIVVTKKSGISSLEELIKKIQAEPDKLNYATSGNGTGSHLSMELMLQAVNGKATAVPYPSSPAALNSLIAGDTQFTALAPIAVLPLVKEGRLVALAQTSATRSASLPDIPTVSEAGAPGIEGAAWSGFVISSKVPIEIRNTLTDALLTALKDPVVEKKLKDQYMDPIPSTPEAFHEYMNQEKARWQPLIEKLNLSVD